MLQLQRADRRHAYEKAAEANERAQSATDEQLRTFWRDMEAKWLDLAGSSQFVERLNAYLKSIRQL
jgi:hypothetical protein